MLDAAVNDPDRLAACVHAGVADGLIGDEWRGAFVFARDELRRRPELAGWWTALFVVEGSNDQLICGMGGFKGPPKDGLVEIGYSIAPSLRGRGLATAGARELVRIAFEDDRVRVVQAHTLAEPNASTRVLEKIGMCKVAEVIDRNEHDGPIWRWQLERVAR